ncbi:hypothetical protein L1887_34733 [Cichorium endivia]|nr:hypothetical protein L1887_34733 [Cichorium endivia]
MKNLINREITDIFSLPTRLEIFFSQADKFGSAPAAESSSKNKKRNIHGAFDYLSVEAGFLDPAIQLPNFKSEKEDLYAEDDKEEDIQDDSCAPAYIAIHFGKKGKGMG